MQTNTYRGFTLCAFADEAAADLAGQIAAMKANGIVGLEARSVDRENISDLSLEKAKELRQKLRENDLMLWSIGSPIGKVTLGDDFPAHLEKLRHTLEVAQVLEARYLRMFSFYLEGSDPADCREEVLDRLGRMQELAEDSGVMLCHENEKGIYGDLPERCLEIVTAIPGMRAVYDPANFVQCGADPMAAWELLAPFVEYVHVKDADAAGTNVPAGEGVGRLPEILARYKAQGGKGLTLEPHLFRFAGLAALEHGSGDNHVQNRLATPRDAFDCGVAAMKKVIDNL